jgi:hypothetical protein
VNDDPVEQFFHRLILGYDPLEDWWAGWEARNERRTEGASAAHDEDVETAHPEQAGQDEAAADDADAEETDPAPAVETRGWFG